MAPSASKAEVGLSAIFPLGDFRFQYRYTFPKQSPSSSPSFHAVFVWECGIAEQPRGWILAPCPVPTAALTPRFLPPTASSL